MNVAAIKEGKGHEFEKEQKGNHLRGIYRKRWKIL